MDISDQTSISERALVGNTKSSCDFILSVFNVSHNFVGPMMLETLTMIFLLVVINNNHYFA